MASFGRSVRFSGMSCCMKGSIAVCKRAVQVPVETVQERADLFNVRPLHLYTGLLFRVLPVRPSEAEPL